LFPALNFLFYFFFFSFSFSTPSNPFSFLLYRLFYVISSLVFCFCLYFFFPSFVLSVLLFFSFPVLLPSFPSFCLRFLFLSDSSYVFPWPFFIFLPAVLFVLLSSCLSRCTISPLMAFFFCFFSATRAPSGVFTVLPEYASVVIVAFFCFLHLFFVLVTFP